MEASLRCRQTIASYVAYGIIVKPKFLSILLVLDWNNLITHELTIVAIFYFVKKSTELCVRTDLGQILNYFNVGF